MNTIDSIDDNLSLSATSQEVDRINGGFYTKFPYPWRAKSIDCTADPDFARIMLNQNLGDWTHQVIPANPHIWIAGCGTNQAVIAALNFPDAVVRGSDVSTSSLEMCASTGRELGCTNLELRSESINQADYTEQFDYIICTGVIHHNANPEATLKKLTKALKPAGVLELMVYNRYHRILTSAFQKGVRLLAGTESVFDYQKELTLTRSLIDDFPGGEGLMRRFAGSFKQSPDMVVADSLMQPVEYSYTVEVLEEMAVRCGLEFILPAPNSLDKGSGNVVWNLCFSQKDIQAMYDQLPDSRRWQIANLFLCENSPMLWFYLRKYGLSERKSEQQICDSFLETRFRQNSVARRSYVLTEENKFSQIKSPLPYPGLPAKPELRRIVEAVGSGAPMGRVLESLGVSLDFATVNDLRLRLTTSTSPFLRSII